MSHQATILFTEFVTHDTKRFILTKPENLHWLPGQGVEMVIDLPEWRNEDGRPFTPTSQPDDLILEFTIKRYTDHHGVTEKLHSLRPGEKVLLSDPFGAIQYKGFGTFIAAGAGITPFLAIFRHLSGKSELEGNRLIFSNKTVGDIICERELRHYFEDKVLFVCTREKAPGYEHRRINGSMLGEIIKDYKQYFYVCGPDEFVEKINGALKSSGVEAESLIFEE